MRMIRPCLMSLAIVSTACICWSTVHAGPNSNAKLLVHLLPPTTKNACSRPEATPPCASVVTAGNLYPSSYFAYILVVDGDPEAGISGTQFGISYNNNPNVGLDVYSWTNCGTLQFPSPGWPESNTGNLMTWDSTTQCQQAEPEGEGTGVKAIVGYFYCAAYSQDSLLIVPRPVDNLAKVASCQSIEDTVRTEVLGIAAFSANGTIHGFNPCGSAPRPITLPPSQPAPTSSGYDPLIPPFQWPYQFTLARNKYAFLYGHLFEPGDILRWEYQRISTQLECNGIVLLASGKPPSQPTAPDPYNEFLRHFWTNYTTCLSPHIRDRVAAALAATPTTLLNPQAPVTFVDSVSVVFNWRNGTSDRILPPKPARNPRPAVDHEKNGGELAMELAKTLTSGDAIPVLWVMNNLSFELHRGNEMREALQLLKDLKVGNAGLPDPSECSRLGLRLTDLQTLRESGRRSGQ